MVPQDTVHPQQKLADDIRKSSQQMVEDTIVTVILTKLGKDKSATFSVSSTEPDKIPWIASSILPLTEDTALMFERHSTPQAKKMMWPPPFSNHVSGPLINAVTAYLMTLYLNLNNQLSVFATHSGGSKDDSAEVAVNKLREASLWMNRALSIISPPHLIDSKNMPNSNPGVK